MSFNTLTFVFFLFIAIFIYSIANKWENKKRILLGFSQIFYASWNPIYIVLLWFVTGVNWWLARKIKQEESATKRKLFLILSIAISLSLLSYFKYGSFLLANFVAFLSIFNINYQPLPFQTLLPIGISFYTFHALSYTIDTYRRKITNSASFVDFSLYMSFFPQLVAGPIVRAVNFLPQLATKREVSQDKFAWGMILAIFGIFQKSVLADFIFAPVVDQLYSEPDMASAWDAWVGIIAFSGQIFFDFAGYSTCAIGLAACFGFDFPENFRSPYGAVGFSDFWRRWHISLSTWLRDYLYISLGGNRGSKLSTYRALVLTMLLGGIWHGASWMFLLWGGLHGSFLVIERLIHQKIFLSKKYFSRAGMTTITFFVITLSWIPFRATDFTTAKAVSMALFRPGFPTLLPSTLMVTLIVGFGTVIWHYVSRDMNKRTIFYNLPLVAQMGLIGFCLIGIFLVSGGMPRGFIYFQF